MPPERELTGCLKIFAGEELTIQAVLIVLSVLAFSILASVAALGRRFLHYVAKR
ncbi:MAG: hypothetical protein J4F49_09975 [Rhodobacteraceae bacterium]|nr:hypothetical protein [Paracoccaceae bacterium]